MSDEDGEIEPGWQKNVLAHVSVVAEPGCEPTEAMRRFIANMKHSDASKAMEERLPVILSELVMLRERAEAVAGVLR